MAMVGENGLTLGHAKVRLVSVPARKLAVNLTKDFSPATLLSDLFRR
jgi:hypothetical protein